MENQEDQFLHQLGRTIQCWLTVEEEAYRIYSILMQGANQHMISITYHCIQSVEAQLVLIDTCFKLAYPKESESWKKWRKLLKRTRDSNDKRNTIVHQPSGTTYGNGPPKTEIHPSYSNSIALAKNMTDYEGPVLDPSYKPSMAQLKDKYKIDHLELMTYEEEFRVLAEDLNQFKKDISEKLNEILTN